MSARSGTVSAARRIAVRRLIRLEETSAFVGLFTDADPGARVDARDERQARDYISGVTRWRRWLDFILTHFIRGDLDKLEPALQQILRLALYELLILNTPGHAAVNEAVELTRALVRPQAARLTNGVLRNVVRAMPDLPEPDHANVAERLAVRHSHPTWMVARWLERWGVDDTLRLLEANNTRPVFGLRVNTRRQTVDTFAAALSGAGVEWERSRYIDYFLRVRQLQAVLSGDFLGSGAAGVQDEAAGLVVRMLDPQPGERVLDLCAAPGGKALHAVQLMDDQGELLAVDVHGGRLKLVADAASRQGATMLQTMQADARTLTPEAVGTFDRVLLDAPCSGTGVLARRADLRWNRSEADMTDLVRLQDELLDAATGLVRPGGLLVYGTCTLEPEENEDRVHAFLSRHRAFEVEDLSRYVEESVMTHESFLATLPHEHGIDGAFGVRLRRRA